MSKWLDIKTTSVYLILAAVDIHMQQHSQQPGHLYTYPFLTPFTSPTSSLCTRRLHLPRPVPDLWVWHPWRLNKTVSSV